MTCFAIHRFMGSLEFVTGEYMVKLIRIETDHLKIPAMMIVVAFNTPFPV